MAEEYQLVLVRHGKTEGNVLRGYIGSRTDQDLCQTGREEILQCRDRGLYPPVDRIVLSPMKRCVQTAGLIWPDLMRQGQESIITADDLRECDFGDFDGKSYADLNGAPDFQHWVDSDGTATFPGGENPMDFRRRCTEAFRKVLTDLLQGEKRRIAFSVHGGTIMSIMAEFARPRRGFYDWHVWNGDGYLITLKKEDWEREECFSSFRKLVPEEDKRG